MKRITHVLGTILLASTAAGCDINLPIDDPKENSNIQPPIGIIQGTVNYLGPSPCFRNGNVEGNLIVLLFDAANPPPPNGLATTALNFGVVPGEKLFANLPRPTTGAGSPQKPNDSLCGSVDGPNISATTDFHLDQVAAGRYIIQAFYSRQSKFNALFDYANLPLAGDVPGGAVVDPTATYPQFATIEVGVPATVPDQCKGAPSTWAADVQQFCTQKLADVAAGNLEIPSLGFVRDGVSVTLGGTFRSNRPYFHIDYANSRSFVSTFPANDPTKLPKDYVTPDYPGQRKGFQGTEAKDALADHAGFIAFPQDHASTAEQQLTNAAGDSCLANKDINCDIFALAQASFPQIRLNYGFPGASGDSTKAPTDAWLAKNAKPANPFDVNNVRPYYGLDPVDPAVVKDIPTSGSFMFTRNFSPATNQGIIVTDNKALRDLAQIADLYPKVVLSKLVEDEFGNISFPARPQTDPVVVVQGLTIRDAHDASGKDLGYGSMKASSQGSAVGGGLTKTNADGTPGDPDPAQPLNQRTGFELQQSFTALLRPSTLCVHPETGFRGVLVTPLLNDPNPKAPGALVDKDLVLASNGNLVKDVTFGCMPPGHYAVNVVYATGQAWSLPNLMGQCSADVLNQPNEDCQPPGTDPKKVATFPQLFNQLFAGDPAKGGGFPVRPLVSSQMVFQTNPDGTYRFAADGSKLPQIVVIEPSARCGSYRTETATPCADSNPDSKAWTKCPIAYKTACITHTDGKNYCDINGDGKISDKPVWLNNVINEDTSLDTATTINANSANGLLDDGEDKGDGKGGPPDGKLEMNVPAVCALPFAAFSTLAK